MIAAYSKSIGVHIPRSRLRALIYHLDPHAHDRLRPAIRRSVQCKFTKFCVEDCGSRWH